MGTKIVDFVKIYADIIIISIVGIFLRGRIILKDDLWYDEAFTGNLMRLNGANFWKVASADPHPPLYYLLLKTWTFIWGVNDLSLRSLSLVFGILTIIIVYFLVKKLFDQQTAAVSALLIAISPFLISYSVEARSYSLYGFFVALAAYTLADKKLKTFLVAILLMLLTHYMAALYLPVLMLWFFWTVKKGKGSLIKASAIFIPLAIVFYFIYLPVLTSSTNNNLNIFWVQKASFHNVTKSAIAYIYGVKSRLAGADELNNVNFIVDEYILGSSVFFTFLIGVVGTIIKFWKDKEKLLRFGFIISGFFVPILILISYTLFKDNNIYVERYLLPSSIFFLISMAIVTTLLLNFEVMGMLLFFYIFTITRVVLPSYYTGMKDLAKEYANSDNEVVFTSPIDYGVGKYYLNSSNVKLYVPKEPNNTYETWPFIIN